MIIFSAPTGRRVTGHEFHRTTVDAAGRAATRLAARRRRRRLLRSIRPAPARRRCTRRTCTPTGPGTRRWPPASPTPCTRTPPPAGPTSGAAARTVATAGTKVGAGPSRTTARGPGPPRGRRRGRRAGRPGRQRTDAGAAGVAGRGDPGQRRRPGRLSRSATGPSRDRRRPRRSRSSRCCRRPAAPSCSPCWPGPGGGRAPVVVHPQFTEPEAALRAAGYHPRRVILTRRRTASASTRRRCPPTPIW